MDLITDSINKKRHIHAFNYVHKQTWECFYSEVLQKKVYVYGAGGGLRHLIRLRPNMDVTAVIDINAASYGEVIGEIHDEAICTAFQYTPVYNIDYLKKICPKDTVILITNVKDYVSISTDLLGLGYENLFVMLLMEFNNSNRKEVESLFTIGNTYVERKVRVINKILSCPVIKDKIVFSIGAYGGHARAITDALLHKKKDIDIVWLVENPRMWHPEGVRLAKQNTGLMLYELETAHIWVYDIMIPQYCVKREKQIYIQTKHWSSLTLKRFYLEDFSTCGDIKEREEIKKNAEWMDIVFSGSIIDEDTCRSGFGVGNIFKRIGSPRSDVLFQEGIREKVYRYYSIPTNKKCIVYAPTFRSAQLFREEKVLMELDADKVMKACAEKFGSEWIVLLRLHPIIAEKNKDIALNQNVIMVSDYPDSQELMAAANILITDYSSLMFEPAYVGKKVFLFAPDRDEYIEKERTLIFDYDALPFPIAEKNDELVDVIRSFDEFQYQSQLSSFLKKYEVNEDGHASERAADIVLDLLESSYEKSKE